jgi:hypothetical protein
MKPRNKEQKKLFEAVDELAAAMKKKLAAKQREGWHGWDDLTEYGRKDLARKMIEHIMKRDVFGTVSVDAQFMEESNLVDIANFCMFLRESVKK